MASTSTDRRQGVNPGAAIKVPCKTATTANITLSGLQTIDGVVLTADDRVLVKDQNTASENGIYRASSSTWQRDKDFDGAFDVKEGTVVNITDGSTTFGFWAVSTADPITPGTTSLTFTRALSDSVNVQFTQSGIATSAHRASRTVNAKLSEVEISVTDVLNSDGTQVAASLSDNTSGFARAVSGAKHIKIPAGTWNIDTLAISGSGYVIEGDGVGVTILKARSGATKLLSLLGSGAYATNNSFKNFTLDITDMTDDAANTALYLAYTYNNTFENVFVTGNGTNKLSLLANSPSAGQGAYTTVFTNCDFGSTTGKIKLTGTSLSDAITTFTFVGCAFGKVDADYCVSITFIQPVGQGTLDKFDLANVNGFYITGGDIEGASGTYLVLGSGVSHLYSIGNELSGFSGTYSSGSFSGGALMDLYGNTNFQVAPVDGSQFKVTGILNADRSTNGIVRHLLQNTNTGASRRVDVQIGTGGSTSEALFFGVDQAASGYKGYLDNRSGGAFRIQRTGSAVVDFDTSAITPAEAVNFVLGTTTGTKIGTAVTQKLGFWAATPIVQPAAANQAALTNSTGGTYDGTLAAVGNTSTGDRSADINNNFTDLHTLLNEIRTALVNAGIIKGAA